MESYQEIRVLPDPEFTEETLMAALFAKLHRALGAYGKGDIGVSFPEHAQTLGGVIRLHGSQSALSKLEESRWQAGLNDYSTATAIHTPVRRKVSASGSRRCVLSPTAVETA